MKYDLKKLYYRLDHSLTTIGFGFGLFVFLFVASLVLATSLNWPTGHLFADMGLWVLAFFFCGFLIVRLARWLRRQNLGDAPPRDPVTTQDLIVHAISILGGPLLLYWFAPRILELRPESFSELFKELRARWIDGVIVGVGLILIIRPLVAFIRYTTRR